MITNNIILSIAKYCCVNNQEGTEAFRPSFASYSASSVSVSSFFRSSFSLYPLFASFPTSHMEHTVTVKQGSKTVTSVSGTATQEYVYGFFHVRNHRYGGNTFSALPEGWNNIVPAGTYRAVYTTKVLREGVNAWITINGATAVNGKQYTFADGKCTISMQNSQASGDIEGACAAAALYLIKVI